MTNRDKRQKISEHGFPKGELTSRFDDVRTGGVAGHEWALDQGSTHEQYVKTAEFHYGMRDDGAENIGRIARAHDKTGREGASPVKKEEKRRNEDAANLRRAQELAQWQERMGELMGDFKVIQEKIREGLIKAEQNADELENLDKWIRERNEDKLREVLRARYAEQGKDPAEVDRLSSAEVIDQTTEIRDELIKTQEDLIRQLKELKEEGDRKFKEIETELDSALARGDISEEEHARRTQEAKNQVADEGGQKIRALEERLNRVKEKDPKVDVDLNSAVVEAHERAGHTGIVLERWRDGSIAAERMSESPNKIVLGEKGFLTPEFSAKAQPQQPMENEVTNEWDALADELGNDTELSSVAPVTKIVVPGMG